jgi:hypothetical protein
MTIEECLNELEIGADAALPPSMYEEIDWSKKVELISCTKKEAQKAIYDLYKAIQDHLKECRKAIGIAGEDESEEDESDT